ncbi:LysR family transcriptional regulator [Clostridium estertheticum]|uniref:LysR family transcriptional regulator n=1 Tax=Clostridium estertheticum TaxID=238834 RepID=A0AA47I937_9CLOT|nr:LysR family transcriptional regulator [Clostridium estertheticum]MBU3157599.1 LysR family transcriptional regulator [Clostridium estertheticum]WAG63218.1 LysR family transcriptional regulator [Clostridium estertheticum]
MNLEWYYTFIVVAKYENYRKAADELFITQTSVFNHIKNLENLLKLKLFEAKGRNIVLTDDGKFFYSIAVRTISTYEKGIYEMKNSKKKYSFRLNVVVTSYIASYLMPKFLPIFFDVAPNIDISISVMDDHIPQAIEENTYHIGIDRKLPNTDKVIYKNVCEGKIKLIVPNVNANKYLKSEIDFFRKYRILSGNHPSYWTGLIDKIYEIVPEADITKISSVHVTESLIKADQGISYLPIYIFKNSVNKDIRIIESKLIEDPISFTYIIWKKDNSEIKLFLELFTQFIKNEQN